LNFCFSLLFTVTVVTNTGGNEMRAIPIWSSLNISIALSLQAIAAHAMTNPDNQKLVEKAAAMQLSQSLGLLLMSLLLKRFTLSQAVLAGGIILFCGSLYAKGFSLTATTAAAPFGGFLMILSWILFAVEILRDLKRND